MILKIESCEATLWLHEPVEHSGFSRIFSFKNHEGDSLRVKMRFCAVPDSTGLIFRATEIEKGQADLERVLTQTERSYLDRPRLLNRGGKSPLNIDRLEFKVSLEGKGEYRSIVLLAGPVDKILPEERGSVSLGKCVSGARADLAKWTANLSGVRLPFEVDAERILTEYRALESEIERTLYNNIQNGKRYGWALQSREGKVDDIHGRRYSKYGMEAEFDKDTPANRGIFKEILDEVSSKVGIIHRARIIGIKGFREILPHHDGHDGTLFYRFHIPIVPNPNCIFNSKGLDFVMDEPGQLYQFPAWETHSVVNYGGERVHLLFSGEREYPH